MASTISAEFGGRRIELDVERWTFQHQRKLSRFLDMTREQWGEAFARQDLAATAFMIFLALGDEAPPVADGREFTEWWDNDAFDFDFGTLRVEGAEPEPEGEDDSHLPTTSAG